eukprot:TRINITY_DN1361_c0_g1_i1.p3 TRINITY_DN1361_c0_g1~~TRINITY_DN1361_c0_g1_i1.p3  ORF type:complete len:54 (+),score=13.51 TRINITY_DN1361_c0_g1_i1:106-267(+)
MSVLLSLATVVGLAPLTLGPLFFANAQWSPVELFVRRVGRWIKGSVSGVLSCK